jgi:hypothetical protein
VVRGKDGKFVEDPNSFDKTPFGVKMTPAMKEWVRAHGGSEFIRQLIEREMEKEQNSPTLTLD